MTRIFAASGVIVAGLILGGLVLGWLVLPALSESEIRQAIARDTGRSISFAGRPRLSLWPELAIELRNVELSNPPDMFDGRFAAADTVRLKVSGTSLWRRAPEVTEVVVVRPRINLLVDSDGRSNFNFERDGDDQADQDDQANQIGHPPIVIMEGSIKYLNERTATAFALSDVDATLSRSGIAGPVELDGAFNWNDQRLTLTLHAGSAARLAAQGSPADFTVSGPYLSAAFSGRAALKEGLELAGTLQFTAEPLADLLSWAGHASPLSGSLPALSASGALDLSRGAIRVTQAELTFGRMTAQGDVALSFTGPRPHMKASLGVDRIDLGVIAAELFGRQADAGWNDAAVDFEVLKLIDAELALAVSEIAYGDLLAGVSRLDVAVADGTLEAVLVDTEVYGGSATGRLTLDGTGPLAKLTATLEASGLDGGKLGAGLSGLEPIRGQAEIDLDLATMGASRHELVARLGGRAHLRLRKGDIEVDIPAMLGHVATEVADGWTAAGAGDTPFTWLDATFAVADGIAETADIKLRGPIAAVNGTGSVDLLRRRLDLRVRPLILDPDGKAPANELPVAVVIEGDWSAPKIYPDVAGILEDPTTAYDVLRKRIRAHAAKLDLGPGNTENEPEEAAATP